MASYKPSPRSKIIRSPQRAHYDKKTLYQVLDAGYLCHATYLFEGAPVIVPTAYVRIDDHIYLHGAANNRLLNSLAAQNQACVAVTHLDGLVLARSAFHHSFNYRSAVIFGTPGVVEAPQEKETILQRFTEQVLPGRWAEVRPPSAKELQATRVVGIKIEEASVKIRSGGPVDDEADYGLPVWAGVLPLQQTVGQPLADKQIRQGIKISDAVTNMVKK